MKPKDLTHDSNVHTWKVTGKIKKKRSAREDFPRSRSKTMGLLINDYQALKNSRW